LYFVGVRVRVRVRVSRGIVEILFSKYIFLNIKSLDDVIIIGILNNDALHFTSSVSQSVSRVVSFSLMERGLGYFW
jgi:hypothetical protein